MRNRHDHYLQALMSGFGGVCFLLGVLIGKALS